MKDERSVGAAVTAVIAIVLLFGATQFDWFHYEHESGRTTAPDGPYQDPMNEVATMDLGPAGWYGNQPPSDPELADQTVTLINVALWLSMALLFIALLGELPQLAAWIGRPIGLGLIGATSIMTLATLITTWFWMPETMAGYGVTHPFTARLDEPGGYTRTTLMWGWVLLAFGYCVSVAAFLFKFQAGTIKEDILEEMAITE